MVNNSKPSEKAGLKILSRSISDIKDNETRFVVIEKGKVVLTQNTSHTCIGIAFYFQKDAPGLLHKVLEIFAFYTINLIKVVTRPSKKQFGDAIFFIDFEGNLKKTVTKKKSEDRKPCPYFS